MLPLLLSLALAGQAPDVRQVTLKGGVEVRTVTIQVTGKNGHAPRSLAQADFTVFENGVRQPITLFVKNTNNPKAIRYQMGYAIAPSGPGEKKHIEVRIRGLRKKITHDFITR